MYELSDLEEDPSYPVRNIQEALSHLSGPLSTWLEEQQPNTLRPTQLVREVARKATDQEEALASDSKEVVYSYY